MIDDEESVSVTKFECEYRATQRKEITELLTDSGCREVIWKFPKETDFINLSW